MNQIKKSKELNIAHKEIAFHVEEREKREAELEIANDEVIIQNAEKEKRAAELKIADKYGVPWQLNLQ